jgi:hypothetical protein
MRFIRFPVSAFACIACLAGYAVYAYLFRIIPRFLAGLWRKQIIGCHARKIFHDHDENLLSSSAEAFRAPFAVEYVLLLSGPAHCRRHATGWMNVRI